MQSRVWSRRCSLILSVYSALHLLIGPQCGSLVFIELLGLALVLHYGDGCQVTTELVFDEQRLLQTRDCITFQLVVNRLDVKSEISISTLTCTQFCLKFSQFYSCFLHDDDSRGSKHVADYKVTSCVTDCIYSFNY